MSEIKTPSDPRVGEIEARLFHLGYVVEHGSSDALHAALGQDVAYLLAQLRARDEALARVEALHVMEYIEDEEYSRNRCAECLYEADDREDCPTIEAIRASVSAATGDVDAA